MHYFSILIGASLFSATVAFDGVFNYSRQDLWPDFCVVGNMNEQSPIDIITDDVEFDASLIDLEMTGWDVGADGNLTNIGSNVRMVPGTVGQITTRNHLGMYTLLNCHFHWGTRTGEGSGHLVDSDSGELEVHCVHMKQDEEDTEARDFFSVISVLADVDEDAPLTGPWAELNVSQVLAFDAIYPVSGFVFEQLLPENRDYYFYEGSGTAPPCYEIVVWFVMRERITVPGAFMEQLRRVEWSDGEPVGFNFRMPQDIGNRKVKTNGAIVFEPVLPLVLLSLILYLI